jgi:hypothetical protein
MIDDGKITAFSTPGGHIRVSAEAVERFRSPQPDKKDGAGGPFVAARSKRDQVEELAAEVEERRMRRQLRHLQQEEEQEAEREDEDRRAQQETADRYAEAQKMRLARVERQEQRERQRADQENKEKQRTAAFRQECLHKARTIAGGYKYWPLSESERSACLVAALAEIDKRSPEEAGAMEEILEYVIEGAAAAFLANHEARELRARITREIAGTVDWQERPIATEAIQQALAATRPDASEAELRAAAKQAADPALKASRQRRQAEEAEEKQHEQKRHKEGLTFAATAIHAPDHLRALERQGVVSPDEMADESWKEEIREIVRDALEAELTGDEGSDDVRRRVHEIIDEELGV